MVRITYARKGAACSALGRAHVHTVEVGGFLATASFASIVALPAAMVVWLGLGHERTDGLKASVFSEFVQIVNKEL